MSSHSYIRWKVFLKGTEKGDMDLGSDLFGEGFPLLPTSLYKKT